MSVVSVEEDIQSYHDREIRWRGHGMSAHVSVRLDGFGTV